MGKASTVDLINLIVDRSYGSRLQKDVLKRKFRKLSKGNPDWWKQLTPLWKYRLACARIYLGDFSDWQGWQYRDEWASQLFYSSLPVNRWDGGYCEKLVILGEQGVGDEVLFASVIPEAIIRVKEVVYECDERLIPIVERSYRIKCIPRLKTENPVEGADAFIPAGDLMPLFRRRREDFPRKPFFKVNPERLAEMEPYRGKIGIVKTARHGEIDLDIENSIVLGKGSDVHFDTWNDLEGVLALCSVLEKVVCVPCTYHHLAASVGCKVEIIVPERLTDKDVDDQVPWSYPPGPLAWYGNAVVYNSVREWKDATDKERH